jgi:hypothetical protein
MPNTDMSEVELQLVTKRDDAIKALKLEGADEQTVRNELAALEWPSYLCHVNHSDLSGNAWSVKDSRSLLCIQRYSKVAFLSYINTSSTTGRSKCQYTRNGEAWWIDYIT